MSSAEVATATQPSGVVDEHPSSHIFVGNMTYQTRESELRECVEKVVGKVKDCHIVFKGPRSQGYGFITFEDESSIDKAIEKLKGHELDGRQLNVERCTPRSERPPRRERRSLRGTRRERRPRGPPSETMIYVGNLPFSMTTDDLASMMGDYKIQSCYVVTRPNGSSKGFGFVHAASHEEQLRILADMKDCTCDDRRLNIRAATSEGPYGPGNDEDAQDDGTEH